MAEQTELEKAVAENNARWWASDYANIVLPAITAEIAIVLATLLPPAR